MFRATTICCDHASEKLVEQLEQARKRVNANKALLKRARKPVTDRRAETLAKLASQGWPPLLPPIKDATLEKKIFRPAVGKQFDKQSNLQLGVVGNSVLNFIATGILLDKLPSFTRAKMFEMRNQITNIYTLRDFGTVYGFDKKLLAQDKHRKPPDPWTIGQTMEAYVGALYLEHAKFDAIEIWFRKLTSPVIEPFEQMERAATNINQYAKQELYALIKFAPQYNIVTLGSAFVPYEVECCVRGSVVGVGKGLTPEDAGNRAAMEALENPEIQQLFGRKR